MKSIIQSFKDFRERQAAKFRLISKELEGFYKFHKELKQKPLDIDTDEDLIEFYKSRGYSPAESEKKVCLLNQLIEVKLKYRFFAHRKVKKYHPELYAKLKAANMHYHL